MPIDQHKHWSAEMLVAIWGCTQAQQFFELNANANIVAMIMLISFLAGMMLTTFMS